MSGYPLNYTTFYITVCTIHFIPDYLLYMVAGRADYFGNLPNLAARVMALAAPGQVLLEGFQGFGPELVHKDELSALLPQQPSRVEGESDYEAVEVLQLGKYPIKAGASELIARLWTYLPFVPITCSLC